MKGNLAIWAIGSLLAFAFGMACGWGSKNSAGSEKSPNPMVKPLGSATTNPAPVVIEQPKLAEQIAFLEGLTTTGLDELPDLMRGLIDSDGNTSDHLVLKSLFDRWVELDPEGGLAFCLENFPDVHGRSYTTSLFARRWARADPEAALAACKESSPYSLGSIGEELAEHRPADFFRLCNTGEHNFYLSAAAQSLAREDPQAMLAFLPQLDEESRRGVSADLAFSWARKNPAAAAAWVRGLEEGKVRTRAFRALAVGLIDTDPGRAAELYFEGGDLDSQQLVSNSFSVGGPSNYRGRNFHWSDAARQLAKSDPLAAFEWAQQFRPDGEHHGLVSTTAPASASGLVDFFNELPVEAFPPGKKISLPREWNPADAAEGLARVSEIANPRAREVAYEWLLFSQAKANPQEAIAAAGEHITPGASRNGIMTEAVASWAGSDPAAASTWLAEQTPGAERDAAISGLLRATQIGDPQAALTWANQIGDEGKRQQWLANVLRIQPKSWAWTALDSLDLDPEGQAAIAKMAGLDRKGAQ